MKPIYNVIVSLLNGTVTINNDVYTFDSEETANKFVEFARKDFKANYQTLIVIVSNPQQGKMYSDADVERLINEAEQKQ